MKKMISALVLTATIFGSIQASADKYIDCENANSTYEMNECAAKEFEKADLELNAVYRAIINKLNADLQKNTDENDKRMTSETKKRLVKSQRAWIAFKEANVLLHGIPNLFGSGESLNQIGSATRMTKERTKELNDLMK